MKEPATRPGRGRRLGWISVLWLVLSCASMPPRLGGPGCPVVPVSSMDLPASTRLRARVRISVGDRELGLEAIARRGPEDLVVVGLAPHGTRLFAARQRGRNIEIDSASSREMERLALWVMDALHRGFWIEPAASSRREGGARWSWEGEQVLETWRDGRWRREFRRGRDSTDGAPVAIDYRDASHRGDRSGFEIRNAWCGYEGVFIPLDEAD